MTQNSEEKILQDAGGKKQKDTQGNGNSMEGKLLDSIIEARSLDAMSSNTNTQINELST